MTTAFTTIFDATYERALAADRRPVAVAIGEDFKPYYLTHIGLDMKISCVQLTRACGGKYPPYKGLPIRAMTASGIAIITAPPHPESGFDIV